jgi:hypothetical protein
MRPSSFALCILLAAAVPVQAAPSVRPAREMTMTARTLADLEDLGEFTVTLGGQERPSFPDDKPTLYAEAVYGVRQGEAWASWTQIGARGEALVVHTPRGDLTVSPHLLRLYLEPDYARTYRPEQAAEAPEIMQDDLRTSDKPLEIVRYALQKGRTYHARVDREGYYLPPAGPEGEPQRRFNRVLTLSDMPFVNGRPTKPPTPRSGSIVY